jgi:hypothetical protein
MISAGTSDLGGTAIDNLTHTYRVAMFGPEMIGTGLFIGGCERREAVVRSKRIAMVSQ